MKKTKKYVWLVLVLLGIISTIVIFLISWYTEQNYVQRCFKSNQLLFEQIVDLSRKIDHEEKGHVEIKTNEDNGYENIKTILTELQNKYQSDSDYPVFSAVDIYYDDENDIALIIHVKNDKLKNGDGIETPDIRCYELVYVDKEYDGEIREKNGKLFYEEWRVWSYDTYSG